MAPEKGAFYSPDYLDYFPVYAKCRGGIFNRVHGAVLLAGRGVPSVIIGNDSRTRMADEFGLPRWHVSEAEPKLVVDQCLQLAHDQGMSDRLAEIEQRAFEALTEELRQAVPREGEQPGLSVHARERRRQSVLIAHFGGLGDLVWRPVWWLRSSGLTRTGMSPLRAAHPSRTSSRCIHTLPTKCLRWISIPMSGMPRRRSCSAICDEFWSSSSPSR